MLQIKLAGQSEFKDEFSFTLDSVADLDLAMSNHWTSTAPLSRFLHSVIVNISTKDGMVNLNNDILKITTGDTHQEHVLADETAFEDE